MSGVVAERLYPPTIPNSLPAFYANSDGTAIIAVPFAMNRSVDKNSVLGMILKIKTVQNNVFLKTLTLDSGEAQQAIANREAKFIWKNINTDQIFNSIAIGQFLKVQLAYIGTGDTVGYFSTVGIIKYTSEPKVYIENAIPENNNYIPVFKQTYLGIYETTEDKSERPYSYCFSLYNNKRGLIETSGWLLHNSSINSVLSESAQIEKTLDQFTFQSSLELNTQYYIQYGVRTLNNLEIYSPLYPTIYTETINSDLKVDLIAKNIFDEGYINLSFQMKENEDVSQSLDDPVSIQIERATKIIKDLGNNLYSDEYLEWIPLRRKYFTSYKELINFTFQDFTIEQGVTYRYCYRLYNENFVYSNRTYAIEDIRADFEDMFLWDGNKQVKIKFNPKMSSFKTTLAEQKIETIGSRYPVFSRNGIINYKEFPISGLISYNSDEQELFVDYETELEINLNKSAERRFTGNVEYFLEENILDPSKTYYYKNSSSNEYLPFPNSYIENMYKLSDSQAWGYGAYLTNADLDLIEDPEVDHIFYEGVELYEHSFALQARNDSIADFSTTSLATENIYAERIFKLKLLEWLNDGKIKLFKSPTEGNYLVRLMNVSLSPEDKVGRMLHTFTSTAYESEEINYNNLSSLGFISLDEDVSDIFSIETIEISSFLNEHNHSVNTTSSIKLNLHDAIKFIRVEPSNNPNSSSFYLRIGNDSATNKVLISRSFELNAGSYSLMPDIYFNSADNANLIVGGLSNLLQSATLSYGYYNSDVLYGELYNIANIYVRDTISTFIGYGSTGTNISFGSSSGGTWSLDNNILRFFVLEFEYKPAENHLYTKNNKFYLDRACTVEQTSFNPTEMYQVREIKTIGLESIYIYIPSPTGEMTPASTYRSQTAKSFEEVIYPQQIAVNDNADSTWYSSSEIKKLFAGQNLVSLTTPAPENKTVKFTQIPNLHITDTTEYSLINLHESIYLKAAYQNLILSYKNARS